MRKWLGSLKRKFEIRFFYPFQEDRKAVESYVNKSISLGEKTVIEEGVTFSSVLEQIGNEVYIGRNTEFENCKSIGAFSCISRNVKLGLRNHPLNLCSTSPRYYLKKHGRVEADLYDHNSVKATVVEDDVLISANAVVLEGVILGKGAVIAAGAVVVSDVEPYAIYGGVPAKLIKYRFDSETIQDLINVDLSDSKEVGIMNEKLQNKNV